MYIRLRYRLCHLLQNCHILLHIPRRTCHPVALEPYDQSIGAELTQARELEGRGRSDKKYIFIFTLAYKEVLVTEPFDPFHYADTQKCT